MKNIKFFVVAILFATLAIGGFSSAQAIEEPQTVLQATFNPADTVMTVDGDSLWKYSNLEYDQLIAMNPEHKLVKVVRGPGDVYVLLPVGIWIKGVKRVPASLVGATPTPTPNPTPTVTPTPSEQSYMAGILGLFPFFSYPFDLTTTMLLLALVVIAYLVYALWFRRKGRGAGTAGPRFAQDGINNQTAEAEFIRQARASYPEGNHSENDFRVENLRRRRGTGAIEVLYNNGTSQTRFLDNELVYIADLHYPDGTVKRDQMLLSACGNPLRRSGSVRSYLPGLNFHFEDDRPTSVPLAREAAQTESRNTAASHQAASNSNGSHQTSVVFNAGKVAIFSGGKTVEMVHDRETEFSNPVEGENTSTIRVKKGGVIMIVADGVITELVSENDHVLDLTLTASPGGAPAVEETPSADEAAMTSAATADETGDGQQPVS